MASISYVTTVALASASQSENPAEKKWPANQPEEQSSAIRFLRKYYYCVRAPRDESKLYPNLLVPT